MGLTRAGIKPVPRRQGEQSATQGHKFSSWIKWHLKMNDLNTLQLHEPIQSPSALSWFGLDFLSLETKGVLANKRPQPPFQTPPVPFCFCFAQPASCLPDDHANSFPSLFSSTDLIRIQASHTVHALGCRATLWLGSSGSVWCEVEKAGPGHRRSTPQRAPRTHLSPCPAVCLPFAKGSGIPPLGLSHKAFLVCFKEK